MLNLNHIIKYAKKENVNISEKDAKTILEYIKKYWKKFYYEEPTELLNELKNKLEYDTYNKLEELYYENKKKIQN
jgi:sulfur relay (sulfurtransferase) DsrC/TusE family protein